jgi:GNAT superfamily N-acetyltransferase
LRIYRALAACDNPYMIIRHALPDDAEALAALSAELGYPVPTDVLRRRIVDLTLEHAVFVGDDARRVVGWIDVGLSFHLQSGTRAEIGGLVVSVGSRNQGIGRQLLLRAEQWAREKGMSEVLLRSNTKRTDAHRFYLRENYKQTKTSAVFRKKL